MRKKAPYIILVVIAIVIHWRWLSSINISYGDWGFFFSQSAADLLPKTSWTSLTALGGVDILLWRTPIDAMYSIAGHLGAPKNISEKLIIFWPTLIIGSIGAYNLVYYVLKSRTAALVGAIIANLNTYYLVSTHFLLYAAGAFATFALWLFMTSLEQLNKPRLIISAIVLCLSGAYDLRVFYLAVIVLVLYIIFDFFSNTRSMTIFARAKRLFPGYILFGSIVVLLNIYWLIATTTSGSLTSNETLNRALFGSEYWTLENALTLFHPFWSGDRVVWFFPQGIPYFFWLLPALAIYGLMLFKDNWKVIFFGVVTVIGILLAKQVDEPFTSLYPWLYSHLPGFSAFRESTKFYYFVLLGYSVLIPGVIAKVSSLKASTKQKTMLCISSFAVAGLFLINATPIVTGNIGTLFTERHIPQDYITLRDFLLRNSEYYRTLWIPRDSRWSIATNTHPKINATDIIKNTLRPYGETADTAETFLIPVLAPNGQELLNSQAVKYVIVPVQDKANEDDFFVSYNHQRTYYINLLNRVPYLKRIDIGTKELAIYENIGFKSYIQTTGNIAHFDDLSNLEDKYVFFKSFLETFNFSTNNSILSDNEYYLKDLFLGANIANAQKGQSSTTPERADQEVYVDENVKKYSFDVQNMDIRVTSANTPDILADSTSNSKTNLSSTDLLTRMNNRDSYYLVVNDMVEPISKQNSTKRNLGTQAKRIQVFSSQGKNLIDNGGFLSGNWDKPESCGELKAVPVNGDVVRDDQKAFLRINAQPFAVCMGKNLTEITEGSNYLLTFKFRAEGAVKVEYEISYNDNARTVIDKAVEATDSGWRTVRTIVTVPPSSTSAKFRVQVSPKNPRNSNGSAYFYDFNFQPLDLRGQVNTDIQRSYKKVANTRGSDAITAAESAGANLVEGGTFEEKLPSDKAGDCNAYDDKPELRILSSSNSKNGSHSLELQARRHVACTTVSNIKVEENEPYLLNFAFQSPNSKTAQYSIVYNDIRKTVQTVPVAVMGKGWQEHQNVIRPPLGATAASIIFYANESPTRNEWIINRYDDVTIKKIPDIEGKYYLLVLPKNSLEAPRHSDVRSISPAKKDIQIFGAKTSFYMSIAESYHPKWQLRPLIKAASGTRFAHVKLNGWQNGWYIDVDKLCRQDKLCKENPDGTYDMELVAEFTPQRWFYVGLIISGTTLLGCLGYLVYAWRRKRRAAILDTAVQTQFSQYYLNLAGRLWQQAQTNIDSIRQRARLRSRVKVGLDNIRRRSKPKD